ncbi:hypothetical protein EJ04DRAFT_451641 [Polyplosphaeria fusca]|uniref:Zn(2)-C6 fungal-type domain-containing protein n=1 Tax=Polyplosphaeria fusca TaxID=682080 RepID=A0A9P4QIW8_9PLEO|nr:hypothetical protein EJ04DRAFT_451641 [Polyplosphaeria fusca]
MYWQPSAHSHYNTFHPPFSSAPSNATQPVFAVAEPAIRNGSKKRRACNECKQQKLRCDLSTLVHPTGDSCSRCKRLGLECRIDRSFRRERKRKRSDELEKEVETLRTELSRRSTSLQATSTDASFRRQPDNLGSDTASTSSIGTFRRPSDMFSTTVPNMTSPDSTQPSDPPGTTTRPYMDTPRADTDGSTADMDTSGYATRSSRTLGNIALSADDIDDLFAEYFSHYHPFFPILEPSTSPAQYHKSSTLLFWTIVSVASRRYDSDPTLLNRLARCVTSLTWKTLQSVPHSQHVVQSLALLCTWPFPTSSSTSDVSYLWAGSMMNISIQMGLHRPTNPQDFTKHRVQLSDAEISERVRTWAACNIVAQSVSIGTGLAAPAQYDWTLISGSRTGTSVMRLPSDLELRLRLEMFRDNVSRSLASNTSDPIGLLPTHERMSLYKVFLKELEGIEGSAQGVSCMNRFCILAARLHVQSFYLFDEPTSEAYTERVLMLYFTALTLIRHSLDADRSTHQIISYSPFFAYQTMVAASFIVLKVLKNDYFSSFVDVETGRKLFNASVSAIRRMSIANNDLPGRLADVLAFLWTDMTCLISGPGKEGLQLKIQSRMSMSVVYDSLWRWREQFRAQPTDASAFGEEDQQGTSHSTSNLSALEPILIAVIRWAVHCRELGTGRGYRGVGAIRTTTELLRLLRAPGLCTGERRFRYHELEGRLESNLFPLRVQGVQRETRASNNHGNSEQLPQAVMSCNTSECAGPGCGYSIRGHAILRHVRLGTPRQCRADRFPH